MDDDFFTHDFERGPRHRDNLFGWTVFILLLMGIALACWIGSFYIFGHPENPRSYKILKRLKKVEPTKRFELTAAPLGEFLDPQKLYERYFAFSRLDLENENAQLMRDYINNYGATKKLVPYVVGRFTILDTFELSGSTLFTSGVVALAQASEYPHVLIEHVYTAESQNTPLLQKMLLTGLDLKLEKTLDLAAVIHIAKLYDGRLQFTVVPLLYGSYALKQGQGTFHLEPPTELNLEAGAPLVKQTELEEAFKRFAQHQKKAPPVRPPAPAKSADKTAAATPTPTPATPVIVRVDTTPTPTPAETPTPQPIVQATPTPKTAPVAKATPTLSPAVKPTATPHQIAVTSPTPTPVPAAIAVATPAQSPAVTSPQGVPLQPFLVSAPTPNTTTGGGAWRTYSPGQMPRGRLLEPREVSDLTDRGVGGERLYLRGQFVVTASSEGRAVLRTQGGLANLVKPGAGATRVIVEYPSGTQPPVEGAMFTRDEMRPFQITDVRKGADGQINVYVREITTQ